MFRSYHISSSFYYILIEGRRQKALLAVALTILSCIQGVFACAA